MAVSVNWATKVIFVPQADLTPLGGPFYEYDVDVFRLELKALEASEEGMPFEDTHEHTAEKTVGGVTYAQFVEIINGYTVEFEDGAYRVTLFGANHNVSDVQVFNNVSLVTNNSAGLIVTTGGGGGSSTTIKSGVVNGASTATVVDTNLPEAAGYWEGAMVQITEGADVSVRRVIEHAAGGVLTLDPPLPFTPGIGATVEVLNQHDPAYGSVS